MKKYKWWFLVLMLIEAAILLDLIAFVFTGNNIFYSGDQGNIFALRIIFGGVLVPVIVAATSEDCHLWSETK